MSTVIDLNVRADRVANRVIELQREEAARRKVTYLTPGEMAVRMGVAEKTLANQRSKGIGPKFVKVGALVRYPLEADEP